ncbi:MAG: aspartate dehydrogenase [Rhodobacter sp.]|uniref:aspartate dehydrogenase n=1 Tax=Pararhodobacter sp. TaxID=2127056 RepID=UPI001DB77843|nr:aspartate dehydrogenase [Pararhodobacter sp.]MCB1346535.1 aspartate dehydrogenase [Paracoccaceae bacterium]MCC0074309.1 aspartate dehydrogenase [Rhodobacter sp.]HPD91640.1 aspartate dehydrogenase [Pararhodobacter sp.]
MHLGLIGYGNIARTLMGVLARENAAISRVSVVSLPEFADATRTALAQDFAGESAVYTDSAPLIQARPDLVVECAGHAAVQAHATAVLRAGIEVLIVSIGALADAALLDAVERAAAEGGTRITLPAGAIGGVDILSALRPSGIESVTYSGRKPPMAWSGTPAEDLLDLPALTREAVFFTGNARDAATQYPKNANVAATLALAGLGFEATQVRLIADPEVTRNIHEYTVRAGAANYTIRIEGNPSPDNPKTSVTTVYSVARAVLNRTRKVAI